MKTPNWGAITHDLLLLILMAGLFLMWALIATFLSGLIWLFNVPRKFVMRFLK
jgi:hypothetical protein